MSSIKEVPQLFLTKHPNSEVRITELYPQIPWELVAGPLGSAEHTFGTTATQFNPRKLKKLRSI
jgi:hypothetical protein